MNFYYDSRRTVVSEDILLTANSVDNMYILMIFYLRECFIPLNNHYEIPASSINIVIHKQT